ncbi:YozQ family protein [Halobacillus litoralis]|uniref:YozQ family protein n=1 Tax=Halobacillus litoralis TaxID=45668 RepID=UPI001CD2C919|nr:YozQ family protein [Halobacillus litoralis]MCA1024056.1 YozQ family protein [Halobacillus litoralis]
MKKKRKQAPSYAEEFSADGLAVTREQVSDTLTEGTYDAKIDQQKDEGRMITSDGIEIKKPGKKQR